MVSYSYLLKRIFFITFVSFSLWNENGLGAITLETRLTQGHDLLIVVAIVASWKKCPLINQSVSSRHFEEDSYEASFQGRNPSQFGRS